MFNSPGLKTNISYRNLETFFSDLLTLSNAKLKFIIGGAKIPCQKCDMRAQSVLDVVESRETIYELPNPEPDGNEPTVLLMHEPTPPLNIHKCNTNKTTTFDFSNHSDQQQQNRKYLCQMTVIIMMTDDADAGMLNMKNNPNQCIKINTDNSRIASP